MIEDFDLKILGEPLLDWFLGHARILPWREEPTAYHVWVSEIMLQQTRVEAVRPYFERFIAELPRVEDLAACPQERLLKLWEGLGYYNRVRNLKEAAQQVCKEYGGVIPAEYEELIRLKGIGSYTAGAISSIAYGRKNPAVDGNVLRVLTRVSGDDSDIAKESTKKKVEAAVRLWLNDPSAGPDPSKLNQALMELGATVCLPNGAPHCTDCPWKEFCVARKEGRTDRLPVKSKAKARRIEKKTVLLIKDGNEIALHKRPSKGLLAGMYELSNVEGHRKEEEVNEIVQNLGYEPIRIRPLPDAKHIFSHVEWEMKGYLVFVASRELKAAEKEGSTKNKGTAEEIFFVEAEATRENYAIPSAFSAYTPYLNLVLGRDLLSDRNLSLDRDALLDKN